MAGKNKVERYFRISFDDSSGNPRDLSADLVPGSVKAGGVVWDSVDMLGVSDSVRHSLWGWGSSPVEAKFFLNDTATTGAHTVLKSAPYAGTLTAQWGGGAAPTTGDPEWEGEYVLLAADISFDGGRAVINAKFEPYGSTPPAWGTVS